MTAGGWVRGRRAVGTWLNSSAACGLHLFLFRNFFIFFTELSCIPHYEGKNVEEEEQKRETELPVS